MTREFVVTRYLTKTVTQRVLVKAASEDEALRLSDEDDAEAVMVLYETDHPTYEIENQEIQTPEDAAADFEREIRMEGMIPAHADKTVATFRRRCHLPPK